MKIHGRFLAQRVIRDNRQERRKCHEKGAYPEQGQSQGRFAHQRIPGHDVLQGRIISAVNTPVARGK